MAINLTDVEDLGQQDLGLTADEAAAIAEAAAEEAQEAEEAKAAAADGNEGEGEAAPAEAATGDQPRDAAGRFTRPGEAEPVADAGAAKAAEVPTADAAAAAAPAETAEAEPAAPRVPRQAVPNWQPPENAEAKLAELSAQRDALAERFDNGEITAKDLFTEQRKLDIQERNVERAQDRAQMAGEMAQAVWMQSIVPTFLDAHTQYRDNETLFAMLDAEVRRQQVAAHDTGADPLDPAILTRADAAIRQSLSAFGVAAVPAADTAATGEPAAAVKPAPALGPKPVIPPTLGGIPSAGIEDVTAGKFDALDRMLDHDPIRFEGVLAALPESEREAYMARTH